MAERHRLLRVAALEFRAAPDAGAADSFRACITDETVDRYGDVILAEGLDVSAYRRNPVVLFGHKGDQPIGRATRVWRDGARWLADFTLAGTDKAREVAQLIQDKVLGAVSVGFLPTDAPRVRKDDDGAWLGYVFPKTELLEFSVVSVPANPAALIQRAIADPEQAAPGREPPARPRQPGLRAMPIGSDIARLKKAHETAVAAAETLYNLADSEGRPLAEEERKTYDGHLSEAERLAAQVADAERLEKAILGRAKPVEGTGGPAAPGLILPRQGVVKVDKGITFARYAMAIAGSKGNLMQAVELAKQWRSSTPEVEAILRAATTAATTTDPTWAGALVPLAQNMGGELIELLMPAAIVGRLNLRRVPFNVRIPRVTGGATANWVGEGKAKPVSKGAFDTVSLGFNKLAVISVLTEELIRFSDPSAEAAVRDLLVASITKAMDSTFIGSAAAVAGVSPPGILNGVTPTASTGGTIAAITADVMAILAKFIAAEIPINSIASVMNSFTRLMLSSMRTVSDTPAFPEMAQGLFFGTRIVDSNLVTVTPGGGGVAPKSDIIFVSEPNVLLAQDPAMRVDVSREATIEMSTDPETETGTMVSMFQSNMIALLVEQFVTWTPARPAAVQLLDNMPVGPVVP